MLGSGAVKPKDTAEERAKNVFMRFVNNLINDDDELMKGWMRTMTGH